MRALESRARQIGWDAVVSDTTDNLASANNFIRAGYRLYQPPCPWAWPNTLYWRKSIRCSDVYSTGVSPSIISAEIPPLLTARSARWPDGHRAFFVFGAVDI